MRSCSRKKSNLCPVNILSPALFGILLSQAFILSLALQLIISLLQLKPWKNKLDSEIIHPLKRVQKTIIRGKIITDHVHLAVSNQRPPTPESDILTTSLKG